MINSSRWVKQTPQTLNGEVTSKKLEVDKLDVLNLSSLGGEQDFLDNKTIEKRWFTKVLLWADTKVRYVLH